MIESIDMSLVNWSRGQFALTAIYHWLFVPLTLGLSFIMAIMETIYVKTGNPEWKRITKFWMTIFGINFAIGVATGLILEFEFGTNWSNYSWFVGDIFGAPLAIEGIMAFFLESTFIAVMFFGWNKISKKFHLASTWLVAIGANLSALWILVANAWMQYPAGMEFNPDTARNEMINFWEVVLSPMAINKFLHTINSGFVTGAVVVVGISSWFLLKKREQLFAKRSIVIASVFGIISSLFVTLTGDGSAQQVADKQPMKLAAMEGLYQGEKGAGLIAFSVLDPSKELFDGGDGHLIKIEIPNALSYLSFRDLNAWVPGVEDLIAGYEVEDFDGSIKKELSAEEKIAHGKTAIQALGNYRKAKEAGDETAAADHLKTLRANFDYFGYGYLDKPADIIPSVPMTFYSFHIMVALGFYFILFFIFVLYFNQRDKLGEQKWLLRLGIATIPLVYLASMAGWITAEMGRQPWVIQDLMPTVAAVSRISVSSVQITFWMFAVIFTLLLIAELKIMFKQIKKGPGGQ